MQLYYLFKKRELTFLNVPSKRSHLPSTCAHTVLFVLPYYLCLFASVLKDSTYFSGTGVALVNICCSTAIVRVFTGKQRSLCLSIAYSAPALSSVVYPNLITVFLNEYGLNGTWLLIGGLFLHSWPLPVLIYFYRPLMEYHVHRPTELEKETSPIAKGTLVPGKEGFVNLALQTDSDDPSLKTIDTVSNDTQITRQIGTVSLTVDGKPNGAAFLKTEDGIVVKANARENDTEEEIDNRQNGCFGKFKAVLVNKPYIFLIIGSSFIMGTCNAYVALVFDIADWKEFTRSQVLVLFIPYSACCTLSRIAPGALEQFKGVNTYVFPIVIITLAVGAQMVILYTTLYALFVVGVCLIGLASGGTLSSVIVLSMNIVKPEQQAMASGMLFTLMGVFSTVCTPIFGKTFENQTFFI